MYTETLASAEKTYDDEGAAHRVAWGAVKHSFEKTGDHWVAKTRRGPSDERSKAGGPHADGESFGGVDVEGKTRAQLLDDLDTRGGHVKAHATKSDIARELQKANQRADRAHHSA